MSYYYLFPYARYERVNEDLITEDGEALTTEDNEVLITEQGE